MSGVTDMKPEEWAVLDLPRISDERGSLTVVEAGRHIPFEVRRVFYLYDVPSGMRRAGHALRRCHQFIVAVAGSLDVIVDNGRVKQRFHLDRPDRGLHVPPMVWRELEGFSAGAVCLVLASELYDAGDYVDEYSEYRKVVGEQPA
jgi:dTDP-4-dehydrorhamnose 3,5-epimerase-like enzyme